MQESPELIAAREAEINAKAAWWQLHEELQNLLQHLKTLKAKEVAAYKDFEAAAERHSQLERVQTEESRRFSSQPTEVGDFWKDADLEALECDAAAASSPLVKHMLMTNIEAERERRSDTAKYAAARQREQEAKNH